jgi:hypothetical protein
VIKTTGDLRYWGLNFIQKLVLCISISKFDEGLHSPAAPSSFSTEFNLNAFAASTEKKTQDMIFHIFREVLKKLIVQLIKNVS